MLLPVLEQHHIKQTIVHLMHLNSYAITVSLSYKLLNRNSIIQRGLYDDNFKEDTQSVVSLHKIPKVQLFKLVEGSTTIASCVQILVLGNKLIYDNCN